MSLFAVTGPRDAGPGDRQEILMRARRLLEEAGVAAADVLRIDVPGKASGGDEGPAGALRPGVDQVVPALQSGSLFGGTQGVLVVDAQQLLKAEAEIIAELGSGLPETVTLLLVALGALPAPLAKLVKDEGEAISVRKMRERDAGQWLAQAARSRRLKVNEEAARALLQRFGSDVAAMGQALDQLAASGEEVTAEIVRERIRNRPDEPVWLYADAVAAGDTGLALRRLSDFLTHGHPLVLLAYLENDLRRRCLAAAAPDLETFAAWAGGAASQFPIQKAWRARSQAAESGLRRALDALSRADEQLKTAPDETHRLTMERLTVALCRWYGGSPARAR